MLTSGAMGQETHRAERPTVMKKKDTKLTDPGGQNMAVAAARIALHDNCEDIVVLDLRGRSPVADFFVIATGTSDRQLRSVADDLGRHGKNVGHKVWRVAGTERGDWIVLDFVDVVVHLFDAEHRHYYDLELIWGECPHVDWESDD